MAAKLRVFSLTIANFLGVMYLCDFTFFLETHFVRKISVIQPCSRLRRSLLAQSKRLDLREISNGGVQDRTEEMFSRAAQDSGLA